MSETKIQLNQRKIRNGIRNGIRKLTKAHQKQMWKKLTATVTESDTMKIQVIKQQVTVETRKLRPGWSYNIDDINELKFDSVQIDEVVRWAK